MSDKDLPLIANLGALFKKFPWKKFPWVVQVTFEVLYYDPPVWRMLCTPDANLSASEIAQRLPDLKVWAEEQVSAYIKLLVEVKHVGA